MRFQIATTLLATCLVGITTAETTEAQKFAASKPKYASVSKPTKKTAAVVKKLDELLSNTPDDNNNVADINNKINNSIMKTINNNNNNNVVEKNEPKRSRLLHTLQKRKEKAYQRHLKEQERKNELDQASPDIGVLSSSQSTIPRFLADYDYYCPEETCPKELCDCANAGGSLEDCSTELQNVCVAGKLSDCVFEEYVPVYQEVYCPWTMCLSDGFRLNQCDCAFYEMYCNRLQGKECEDVIQLAAESDGEDKKPFFGCDETEMQSICDQAKTCKEQGQLEGLPDLGTWQGTTTVGIAKQKSGGERVQGSLGVVAGVTALSMLWCLVNA